MPGPASRGISTAVEQALAGAALHAGARDARAIRIMRRGAPALAARFPSAAVSEDAVARTRRAWPVLWEPLADGDVVDAGDTSLVAVHTPGHAPDHLCFWHEGTRTLFVRRSGGQGHRRCTSRRPWRRPVGLPRVARAGAARCSRAACCRRMARSSTIPTVVLSRLHRAPARARGADPRRAAPRRPARSTRSSRASIAG